ncbi:MAG TPA: ZPR1 zinc finger domain-containing protein [Candidatus Poseidoniaceae archaeon]|nr:ZPR1 zinc finger domain-containing protein [Candidatus Poseidoniaceae archaeon]
MQESPVDIACPICHQKGDVYMIAHIDEIPYFGEHTQVTVLCHSCGWKQTDFIPAEGQKAGCWSLLMVNSDQLKSRVVRSSSCTIRIPELDLQVNPGSNATGYVSNVEGVLNRFVEVINMVLRDLQNDVSGKLIEDQTTDLSQTMNEINQLEEIIAQLTNIDGQKSNPFTLELLDPHGHSMIMDEAAIERDLTPEEIATLPTGPDPAVFSA